jgi:predicted phosphodiesterase
LGEKQLSYAIDVLEEMLDTIIKNISGTLNMFNVPGNHDRIGQNRSDDKNRTGGAIVFSVLKKLYSKTPNDVITIENPEDGIISMEKDKISIVCHHGDATLSKRKPLEILNVWKKGDVSNYSVIIQGHWHQYKVEEGSNYTSLGIGSVCSADNYIQNELGLGTQPSYVMGHRNDKYGFDFKKITLY